MCLRTIVWRLFMSMPLLMSGAQGDRLQVRAERVGTPDEQGQLIEHSAQEALRDLYLRNLRVDNLVVTTSVVLPEPFDVSNFVKRSGDTMYGALAMLDGQEVIFSSTSNLFLVGLGASPDTTQSYALVWPIAPSTSGLLVGLENDGQLVFVGAIDSLNGQTGILQTFTTDTQGVVPTILSASDVHVFNIPNANIPGVLQGLISNTQTVAYNAALNAEIQATSANIPLTLVLRDAQGSFNAQHISAQDSLFLPSTSITQGQLLIGAVVALHATGTQSIYIGGAGNLLGDGSCNSGVGFDALDQVTTGTANTALGCSALANMTAGSRNAALGALSLTNYGGSSATAVGYAALQSNSTGTGNVAVGRGALGAGVTHNSCTAVGFNALAINQGDNNTAYGNRALVGMTTGNQNVAIGDTAMSNATTTSQAVAVGYGALQNSGSGNTGVGTFALSTSTTGAANVAAGYQALALSNGSFNTSLGSRSLIQSGTDSYITAVGTQAAPVAGLYTTALGASAGLGIPSTTCVGNVLVGSAIFSSVGANSSYNTYTGFQAAFSPVSGSFNVGVGNSALKLVQANQNVAVGFNALTRLTTGTGNVAMGSSALTNNAITTNNCTAVGNSALLFNTGDSNTAVGYFALQNNRGALANTVVGALAAPNVNTGNNIVAVGFQALSANFTGTGHVAIGYQASASGVVSNQTAVGSMALSSLTNRVGSTAVGSAALQRATTALNCTAVGYSSLSSNLTSVNNTGVGYLALANTTGASNSSIGTRALASLTTGNFNTGCGNNALANLVGGSNNTAIGDNSLAVSTVGLNNVAVGNLSLPLSTGNSNTAVGYRALGNCTSGASHTAAGAFSLANLRTGSSTIGLGFNAGSAYTGSESNNVVIGLAGTSGESNVTRINNISGVNIGAQVPVLVTATGQLGINASSQKSKTQIACVTQDQADVLWQLRPVEFQYCHNDIVEDRVSYGLIAEEVAQCAPELVYYDDDGFPQTVLYHHLVGLYIRQIQSLQAELDQLQLRYQALKTGLV